MHRLEKKLGYTFREPAYLSLALTHPSTNRPDNQRLEFLGDAVLEFCVSDMLYRKYPSWQEGKLTARRAALVCEKALSVLARSLDLGRELMMGGGEELTGGREKDSILCDAFEAVLAAVYMDGGMEAAQALVLRLFAEEERLAELKEVGNFKGDLQILTQNRGLDLPSYQIVDRTGPDDCPRFVAQVSVQGKVLARGEGLSKQKAEQAAAGKALELLRETE